MGAEKIAVVGAGLMGHGIAQVFAEAGHPVAIYDPSEEALATVLSRICANIVALGRDPLTSRLVSPHGALGPALEGATLIVEAAPEKLELKRSIFAELERLASPEAILATNTSVMPVSQIVGGIESAHRAVGTHWWNPPYLVDLVEVVQGKQTSLETVRRTQAILSAVGKQAVHVKRDVPGFVGNRLQHALWREAIALVAGGVCDGETVDLVVKAGFGRRLSVMGPIETADYVGLDLTLDIHEQILFDLDRTPGPSPHLRDLVDRGHLGMKTGRGLREWGPEEPDRSRARLLNHLNVDSKVKP